MLEIMDDLERLKSLPATAYNWAEAFTHYCGGLPLEDISHMMNIPLEKVEARHQRERWPMMKGKVEAQMLKLVPTHPDDIAKRGLMVQANREKNYELWCKLREEVAGIIDQLRETGGAAMFKKYWHNKGQIVEHACDASMSDRLAIANYLQVIAQGTYAALGDRVSSSGAKDGEPSASNSGQPIIQIILPEFIAKPRAERELKPVKGSDNPAPPIEV
jgi:hypothetical protein